MSEKIKILIRYLFLLFLIFIINLEIFEKIFLNITLFMIKNVFIINNIIENSIIINNNEINIIKACLSISAYFLFSFLFFSLREKFILLLISLLFSFILFTIFNIIRIIILIYLLMDNYIIFKLTHFVFYEIISGFVSFLIFFFFYNYFKFKSIPVFSDINILLK